LSLVRDGFYNGLHFHRVIKDFMLQFGSGSGDHHQRAATSDFFFIGARIPRILRAHGAELEDHRPIPLTKSRDRGRRRLFELAFLRDYSKMTLRAEGQGRLDPRRAYGKDQ
jgi:hypothetical protein